VLPASKAHDGLQVKARSDPRMKTLEVRISLKAGRGQVFLVVLSFIRINSQKVCGRNVCFCSRDESKIGTIEEI